MRHACDVGLFLQPVTPALPFRTLLTRWLEAGCEPAGCRAALAQLIDEHRLPAQWFELDAFASGGMVATDTLLLDAFAAPQRWKLSLVVPEERSRSRSWLLAPSQVAEAAAWVRALSRGDPEAPADGPIAEAAATLAALPQREAAAVWPELLAPGIYRREHASVAIRSRTTAILVDPLRLALGRFPAALAQAPHNHGVARFDALAVTHVHADHFHLPSLLHFARDAATKVLVPDVPQAGMLTPEVPQKSLALAGQAVLAPPWHTRLTIGDIDIEVLPFYGEQPTRSAPGPAPPLRNWGSCYRFDTPDFSAMVLVDSGADPAGDMAQVAASSRAQRGPVDVVLSCVQQFPSPFFSGVANECLTLPFARVRELFADLLHGRLPSTTAGPTGVVDICAAAQARYFLTYANGFTALGRDNGVDWGSGPAESLLIAHIGELLRRRGCATQALCWNPGDAVLLQAGALLRVPYPG